MLKKIILGSISLLLLLLTTFSAHVLAAAPESSEDIPDEAGTYPVPDHPHLKLRVFVHHPKTSSPLLLSCDFNNPDSPSVVDPTGWHLPSQWTYQLNPSSAPSTIGSASFVSLTALSFNTWQTAVNNKVNFTQGPITTTNSKGLDGKNLISWGSAPSSALAITYTWYYPSTGEVAEQDTILNKKYRWSWWSGTNTCNPNAYDAQNILTHELGHWLGLDDEYTDPYTNNTMFGYASRGEIKKDTLTQGDIAGLTAIYHL